MTLTNNVEVQDTLIQKVWVEDIHTEGNERICPWVNEIARPIFEEAGDNLKNMREWNRLSPQSQDLLGQIMGNLLMRAIAIGIAAERYEWPVKQWGM